jgi:hypothetical protein
VRMPFRGRCGGEGGVCICLGHGREWEGGGMAYLPMVELLKP